MKRRILVVAALALVLAGCAGPNPLMSHVGGHGVAGFWVGIWHGMICPIAYVISFFNKQVSIYEVHNSGALYNGGFILGAGAWGLLRGSGRR